MNWITEVNNYESNRYKDIISDIKNIVNDKVKQGTILENMSMEVIQKKMEILYQIEKMQDSIEKLASIIFELGLNVNQACPHALRERVQGKYYSRL